MMLICTYLCCISIWELRRLTNHHYTNLSYNQYLFAFLSYLVHLEWYAIIEMHMLLSEHSYYGVNIDCFAQLGRRKKIAHYMTLDEFWPHLSAKKKRSVIDPWTLDDDGTFLWTRIFVILNRFIINWDWQRKKYWGKLISRKFKLWW